MSEEVATQETTDTVQPSSETTPSEEQAQETTDTVQPSSETSSGPPIDDDLASQAHTHTDGAVTQAPPDNTKSQQPDPDEDEYEEAPATDLQILLDKNAGIAETVMSSVDGIMMGDAPNASKANGIACAIVDNIIPDANVRDTAYQQMNKLTESDWDELFSPLCGVYDSETDRKNRIARMAQMIQEKIETVLNKDG